MMSRFELPADGRGRVSGALALLSAVLLPLQTQGQPLKPVELEWHAPAGCPSAADVLARMKELSGTSNTARTPVRAVATVTRTEPARLHLKLIVRAGSLVGERNIEGTSCHDLAGAAAVNLALLLRAADAQPDRDRRAAAAASDPSRDGRAPATTSAPAAADPNAATSPPAAPAAEPTAARSDERALEADDEAPLRLNGLLQAPLVSLAFGALPLPSFGAGLAAGVSIERWRLLAEGTFWLPRTLTLADRANVGANVGRVDATLRGCHAFSFGWFALAPCLNVSVTHAWARGTGAYVDPRTASSTWIAAGAGAQARIGLAAWFHLLGSLDVRIETARPQISIEGLGPLGRLGTASLRVSLGSEWIL